MSAKATFLVWRRHGRGFVNLLADWTPDLQGRIDILHYDDILKTQEISAHPLVIFSDIDWLAKDELATAIRMADRLILDGHRVLNHPAAFVGRLPLLNRLHEAGFNEFKACRMTDLRSLSRLRYPAFARDEVAHSGALSGLVNGPVPLLSSVARRIVRHGTKGLLAVEYQNMADPETGLIRKYSYMRVGDQYIPRHLFVSREWVIKYADVMSEDILQMEMDFIQSSDFLTQVKPVFRMAGIEYGRIDFSVRRSDGRLQVWEINSNPSIAPPRSDVGKNRIAPQELATRNLAKALIAEMDGAAI
ncbi:hypothetical protein KCG44_07795 [Pacificimonas sp. WHA3]|uniref:ATP-grasp domain-containing protein n=1 Tax=Pacificimonas pallii TaxID=2827236 RepID=A0ABS6SEB2_9SPHN|nr:hypothetical protein [Pacificimonas pallii]MBV7256686.1 hypothetical protein [Pacificimonas pallii]